MAVNNHQPRATLESDLWRDSIVHQRPEALTNAGGIHDGLHWAPGLGEGAQCAKDGDMLFAGPFLAEDPAVGRFASPFR